MLLIASPMTCETAQCLGSSLIDMQVKHLYVTTTSVSDDTIVPVGILYPRYRGSPVTTQTSLIRPWSRDKWLQNQVPHTSHGPTSPV
jgi:hypothetical protein